MNAIAGCVGVAVDRLFGEPPPVAHPVVWFARVMSRVERVVYRDQRSAGVVYCAVDVGLGIGTGLLLRQLLSARLAAAVASTVCVAGRMFGRRSGSSR